MLRMGNDPMGNKVHHSLRYLFNRSSVGEAPIYLFLASPAAGNSVLLVCLIELRPAF